MGRWRAWGLAAGLAVCGGGPAGAWLDSAPGGAHWPPIPGNAGLAAFYGAWFPQCDDGAWQDQGRVIVEPGGVLRYTGRKPYFPTEYRVIETTPYGVTLVVRYPPSATEAAVFEFWVLRYLQANRDDLIGVHSCFPRDAELKGFSWDLSDEALGRFWAGFAACNPALTAKSPALAAKDERHRYWGEGWSNSCDLYR